MNLGEGNSCYLIGEASLLIKCGDILLNNGFFIKGVISKEGKICEWVRKNDLSIIDPNDDYIKVLKEEPFDFLFSIVNYKVLKKDVLDLPEKMAINFHDAILPRYGGIHATSWALMNDEKFHGITWHIMEEGVDKGNILKQKKVDIDNNETAFSLNLKCYIAAVEAFEELVDELSSNAYNAIPQNLEERTYYAKTKRPENGGVISWPNSAENVDRLVRAMDFGGQPNSLGCVKIFIKGHFYIISKTEIKKSRSNAANEGKVIKINRDSLVVGTTTFDISLKLTTIMGEDLDILEIAHNYELYEGFSLENTEADIEVKLNDLYVTTGKHENYWKKRLLNLEVPIVQDIIRMDDKKEEDFYIKHQIQIPNNFIKYIDSMNKGFNRAEYIFLAVSAFIARIGENQSFDIGFSSEELKLELAGLENKYSNVIPYRVDIMDTESIDDLFSKMTNYFENIKKKKTYAFEMIYRLPELLTESRRGNTFNIPIVVEESRNINESLVDGDLVLLIDKSNMNCCISFKGNKYVKEKTIRLMDRLSIFLNEIAINPNTPIMKINILSIEEHNKIVVEWNNNYVVEYPKEKCTYELIEEQVLKTPDNIAVIYEDSQLTYRELNTKADQLASYLKAQGIEEGKLVGVFMERSIDLLVALIGIWKTDCAYVPLDPIYPKDRLLHMIEDAELPLIITQADLIDRLPETTAKVVQIDLEKAEIFNETNLLVSGKKGRGKKKLSTRDRLAYVIFTSGSTGKPKGVEVTQLGLTNYLWFVVESQGFTEKDKFMALTTICFDISLCELFANLIRGGQVEILPTEMQRDPYLLMEKIENNWATAIQATPATWDMLITVGWEKKLPLKIYCGGEAMSPELAEKLIGRCNELWNIYGPTEATIWSSISHIKTTNITIGHPVYNTQYYVLDKNLNPVPEGTPGELFIGGDGLARGYLNRKDMTDERFISSPFEKEKSERIYKTGDSVRFLPDGDVEWLGRIDNQVKLRGFRIELGEIETVLKQQAEIEKAVVVLREDNAGFKGLYAFISAEKDCEISVNTKVGEKLKDFLPSYMIPGHYIYLNQYPLTMNKKVDRKSLSTMTIDEIKNKYGDKNRNDVDAKEKDVGAKLEAILEAKQEIKQEIKQATQQNLDIERKSVEDTLKKDLLNLAASVLKVEVDSLDFLTPLGEYGYDSVSFTVLSIKMKEKYKVSISPAIFYSYASLEKLTEYIYKTYQKEVNLLYAHMIDDNIIEKAKEKDLLIEALEVAIAIEENVIHLLMKDLGKLTAQVIKCDVDKIDFTTPLGEYGYDSVSFTVLSIKIKGKLAVTISPAIFYSYSTIEKLSNYIFKTYKEVILKTYSDSMIATDPIIKDNISNISIEKKDTVVQWGTDVHKNTAYYSKNSEKEPIAVIGIGGIMPLSPNMDVFWDNLVNEIDMITEVPKDRWDPNGFYGEDAKAGTSANPIRAGFIEDVDKFDAAFFSISPREAQLMDPQQRLFMETVWKTVEDAGYKPSDLSNSKTGVYVGVVATDYWDLMSQNPFNMDTFTTSGRINCVIANRISYMLNLRGPSATIDTACSSSLVAVHRAVAAMQDGYCDGAIVGGVNVMANPFFHVAIGKKGMLSADGRCKTFDESADGYVRAEGVGAIYLKPLSKAEADGDHIYAIIKSSVENHGGRSNSLTAPSAEAQSELLVEAYEKAGISPDTISYIETHGTGTSLGDPIEINALKDALNKMYQKKGSVSKIGYCGVGSVKTNIGHLEAGAGVAGMLKVLLSFKNGVLPGNINLNQINPYIEIEDSPLYLVRNTKEWTRIIDDSGNMIPRRAGVSSFGFGGSNAHVTLEEYHSRKEVIRDATQPQLIILSARNEGRLKAYGKDMVEFIQKNKDIKEISLLNFAFTLQTGREEMDERLAVIVHSFTELEEKLCKYLDGKNNIENLFTNNIKGSKKRTELLMEGDEGEEFLKNIIKNKKLSKLAQLWIIGVEINWDVIYANCRPKRLPLPTYPFEKVRHWIPETQNNLNNTNRLSSKALHPFIDSNESTLEEQTYKKTLNKYDESIQDHIANNETIFPGVAYLEMARAAGQLANHKGKVVKLQNNVWSKALILKENPIDISISLNPSSQGVEYKISSKGVEGKSIHAQGKIEYKNGYAQEEFLDISLLRAKMQNSLTKDDCYHLFSESGFQYGRTYRSINHLYYNQSEALSQIELPQECKANVENYMLPPALLDGALQSVIVFIGNSFTETGTIYMPFAMGELEILGELPEKCFSYAIQTENQQGTGYSVKKFAIYITDEAGKVLVKMKDFSLRGLTPSTPMKRAIEKSPSMSYMKNSWELSSIEAERAQDTITGNILVFDEGEEVFQGLMTKLNGNSESTVLVKPGLEYKELEGNIFEININNQEDYRKLFSTLLNKEMIPDNVLHLLSKENLICDKEKIMNQLNRSIYSMLYLSRALLELKLRNKTKLVYFLRPESIGLSPQHSAIKGFLKGLEIENSRFSCKTVETLPISSVEMVTLCMNELGTITSTKDKVVRYENGNRFVCKYVDILEDIVKEANSLPIVEEGVYIITGGAGSLGFIFAEYLAKKVKAKLILLGRSALNDEKAKRLKELEALGSEITYLNIDISKVKDVESILKGTRKKFGKINGIIHCAGVTKDSFIFNKTKGEVDAVIAPKVWGTIWLDELTKEDKLDFFVMFSSISSILGNTGQSDYAYANSFMDDYAKMRDVLKGEGKRFGKTLAIGWPFWKDGGMKITAETEKFLTNTLGIYPMEIEEGIKAFEIGLTQKENYFIVLKGYKEKLNALLGISSIWISQPSIRQQDKVVPNMISSGHYEEKPMINMISSRHNEEKPMINMISSGNNKEKINNNMTSNAHIEENIIKALIKMTSQIQKINESDIDAEGDISEFGFDSIAFTEFSNQINQEYDLGVMPSIFFEHQNLNSLGKYLYQEYRETLEKIFNTANTTEVAKVTNVGSVAVSEAIMTYDVPTSLYKKEIGIDLNEPEYKDLEDRYQDNRYQDNRNQGNRYQDNSNQDNSDQEKGLLEAVIKELINFTSKVQKLNINDIDAEADISEFGFDSIAFTELSNEINGKYNIGIMPSIFFEYSTLASLAKYLVSDYYEQLKQIHKGHQQKQKVISRTNSLEIKDEKRAVINNEGFLPSFRFKNSFNENSINKNSSTEIVLDEEIIDQNATKTKEAVAIVGMSGVMPQSKDLKEFWGNLEAGKDLITEIPKDRWDWKEIYGDPVSEDNKTNVKWGGFMKEVDKFDPLFFGISPKEAVLMDPQQRIFMENVWRSLEDSGLKPSDISGTKTGVFIGAGAWDYLYLLKENDINIQAQTSSGVSFSILANRVSYLLNLHGPSETIDTACSSSLVALHRAVEQIQNGNCEMAFAGGINVMLNPAIYISLSKAGMLCEDGRCKTFDKAANGYVRGEGCGVLLLKPLSQAIKDKNHIYGVIKGSAVNHGGHANSLTTPNPNAQSELIQKVWRDAQVNPSTITYMETHGTGTSLGDPIEINGLKKAFDHLYQEWDIKEVGKPYCGLGAVKTNIGHLEWGSGVAGVIKVLLAMKYKKLPASINFKEQNPYIKLENSPFYIINETKEWEALIDENNIPIPRRAGVSSFGFGGVNAHIAIEEYEYPETIQIEDNTQEELVLLSAKNEDRLIDYARQMIAFIEDKVVQTTSQDLDYEYISRLVQDEIKLLTAIIIDVNKAEISSFEELEDYGFDLVSLNKLAEDIGNKFEIELSANDIASCSTIENITKYLCNTYYQILAIKFPKNDNSSSSVSEINYNISLADIAYTLRNGREEMDVRLAMVVHNVKELKNKLEQFVNGSEKIEGVSIGNKTDKSKIDFLISGEKGKEFISDLLKDGKLLEVAQLWATGAKIEWSKLYNNELRVPISLPTYPFAKERYWITDYMSNQSGALNRKGIVKKLHPLVDINSSNFYEQRFTTVLNKNEFYLKDHVVDGQSIFPGVAYIEMARAAGQMCGAGRVSKVSDILWAKPIIVDQESKEIHISLLPDGEDVEYEVVSMNEDSSRTVYSQGKLIMDTGEENDAIEFIDIEEITSRCNVKKPGDWIYKTFKEMAFNYGETFQPIKEIFCGENEALARLEVSDSLTEDFDEFILHPALMDGSLQTIIGMNNSGVGGGEIYLPFTMGEVEIIKPLEKECYAYGQMIDEIGKHNSNIRKYNIQITDTRGRVLVKINDFVMRAIVLSEIKKEEEVHYYHSQWSEEDLVIKGNFELQKECILIFDTNEKLYNELLKKAPNNQANIWLVKPGKNYREVGNNIFEISPEKPEDYKALIEMLGKKNQIPDCILHFWSKEKFEGNEASLNRQMDLSVFSTFNLSKALMEARISKKVKMVHIHASINDNIEPHYRSVSGLAKTVGIENPNLNIKTVEVQNPFETFDRAVAELAAGQEDGEVRYENGLRLVRRYKKLELDIFNKEKEIPVIDHGVYLITGGVGGLGLIFAEYFAKRAKVKLVLTGRSDLSNSKKNKIKEIEKLGSEVTYVKCDISNKDKVSELVNEVKKKYGCINGIIHAAGVIKDSFILKKTLKEMKEVISPKLYGTIWIDELTKDENLDFFVVFSSIAAVTGNIGQSDYAYANSFLDNYAQLREVRRVKNQRSGITISINWPLWKDGGMKMDESLIKMMDEEYGFLPITNNTGINAFEAALKYSVPNMIVVKGEESRVRSVFERIEKDEPVPKEFEVIESSSNNTIDLTSKVEKQLKLILSKEINLPVERISVQEPFEKYGIDSIMIVSLNRVLENHFGKISKTLLFEYKNVKELAKYFAENHRDKFIKLEFELEGKETKEAIIKRTNREVEQVSLNKSRFFNKSINPSEDSFYKDGDIAIIGVSGRYPMANNLEEFWKNLKAGKDCVTEIPEERWDKDIYFDPDKNAKGKSYSKWGGFIENVDKFDPMFFNISPKEAEFMDPQERIFLETVWHTIEDAGYTRAALEEEKVGVFAGVMYNHYPMFAAEESLKGNVIAVNSSYASIANRVSYYLNLRGPSIALDTMCSSSITAVHLACESIKRGESDLAIAGGVNVTIHPNKYILLSQGKFAASDGKCKSFGESGDGYVPGEGVGALLLKPLEKAIADGDKIYSVIKGSSLNHGGKTNGYSVPSPKAQGDLILDAFKRAKVDPRTISYLEAHGTGTSLGDPIEIAGLVKAFHEFTNEKQFCSIGSAKSNIGHLESAAGIAGISKVLLQMKYKQLVPSIHSKTMNPNIDFEESPFYVQHEVEEWKNPVIDGKKYPRRAGISSFGAGGSNAHIILEEYEAAKTNWISQEPQLILISARDEERLNAYLQDIIKYLDEKTLLENTSLSDIAYTLQVGRESMEERIGIVAATIEDLISKLRKGYNGEFDNKEIIRGSIKKRKVNTLDHLENNQERYLELFKAGKLVELAGAWVLGEEINWKAMYSGSNANIVSLPVYPFARERYWIAESEKSSSKIDHKLDTLNLHPLIGRNTSTLKEQKFSTIFSGEEFCFTDHIVEGKKMLPGAAYLEMAKAAGDLSDTNKVVKIKDILWAKPIIISDSSKEINISLIPEEEYVEYEISEMVEGKDKVIYSSGKLVYDALNENKPINEKVNIGSIRNKFHKSLKKQECYEALNNFGINYGASFKVIEELFIGDQEALGVLKLPKEVQNTRKEFLLHPSILDGCFQAIMGVGYSNREDDVLYLPFAVEEIQIFEEFEEECFVYIELVHEDKSSRKYNISLLDNQGKVLVKIINFTVKAIINTNRTKSKNADTDKIMELLNKLYAGEVEVAAVKDIMEVLADE